MIPHTGDRPTLCKGNQQFTMSHRGKRAMAMEIQRWRLLSLTFWSSSGQYVYSFQFHWCNVMWCNRIFIASDWCALQEALYKCIDTIQYNLYSTVWRFLCRGALYACLYGGKCRYERICL